MRRFVVEDTTRVGAPSPNTVLSPSEMQPPPASSVPREVPVREGSVIVFLDDPKLGKLAWRGEVAEQIRASSPEQTAPDHRADGARDRERSARRAAVSR